MNEKPLTRVAFSPGEFAALFGKSQTWGYRQLYSQKVKAIDDHGRIMIPASEVERILNKAGEYNGLKIQVPKKGKSLDPWRQFIKNRREQKISKSAAPAKRNGGNTRKEAMMRFLKKG